MYCKNCGKPMVNEAVVCVSCGVPKGVGANFCWNCAAQCNPMAAVCTNCGVQLDSVGGLSDKSKMVAGLLGIFLGSVGIHRFYLGFTTIGIIQIVVTLVTCGIGSLWGFIEGIVILCGGMNKDVKGRALKE